MIRKLLATTALATVIATSAFAQGTTAPAAETPAATAPAADAMAPAATTSASAMQGQYLQGLGADQYLASKLTGQTVYQNEAPDAEAAGEIQNFLVGKDGKLVAAILDTGSFLEEKKIVALPIAKLSWAMGENNEPRAILSASREELIAAPAFTETTAADAAANGTAAPAVPGTAATTGGAASTGTAATTGAAPMASTEMAANGDYPATVGSDQYLSQDIIGGGVYSGPAANADQIGSINDLVVAKSGDVAAALVGVGGFLGIGEKNVGVPFAELQMTKEEGNETRVVLAATKEQLTSAPTFEADKADMAANGGSTTMAEKGAAVGTTTGAALDQAADATRTAAGEAADTASTAVNKATTATSNAMDKASTATNEAVDSTGEAAGDVADSTATTAGTAAGAAADATTTASTGGDVDRSAMTAVEGPELSADKLVGTTVYGPNDESIGEVGDIAMTETGQVDAIIVDVGGFLGIGEKPVAVAMDNLQFMKDSGGSMYLYTQFTQDQLKNAPEYNSESYAQNRSTMRLETGDAPDTTPAPAQ